MLQRLSASKVLLVYYSILQMVRTHFDIAFACNHFAQHMAVPFASHWQGLKQIFCYLQGPKYLVLQYGGQTATLELVGYCDAD